MPAGPVQAVPPPPPAATEPKQVPRPPHLDLGLPLGRGPSLLVQEETAICEGLEGLQVPGGSALPAYLLVAKQAC